MARKNGTAPAGALTAAQEAAIAALVEGRPLGDVASAAGVAIVELLTWLQEDAHFIAALNVRRQREYDQQAARVQTLVSDALDVLGDSLKSAAVERKFKLQAAALVLKAAGLVELGRPEGDTNPKAIEHDRVLDDMLRSL